jgi:integrase
MIFMTNGLRVRKSTGTTNKRAAQEIEAAYRVQLAKGEVGFEEKQPVPTFKAAVAAFLDRSRADHAGKHHTVRRAEVASKALLRFFGDKPLDQISVGDVERYKDWRKRQRKQPPTLKVKKNKRATTNQPLKPATVNRELAFMRAMMNHFIKLDILTKANPVSRVKFFAEDNEQMRVVTYEEERLYLLAASQPLRDVAVIMIETGMRPEEVCRLERRHVHLDKGYILNPYGKTKAARRKLPLSQRAAEILRHRLQTVKGDYVFPGTRGGKDASRPIVKLNNAHRGAVTRAKLDPFRLYDLRHTFATRAAEAGVDLVTLAALLGHSRVQMVMRYAHPSERHQFEAIRRIEANRAGKHYQQEMAS